MEIIAIKSLALLEMINKHKGMTALASIEPKDEQSFLPVYYFNETDNVTKAVDEFFEVFEHDDRSMDNWDGFNYQEFYEPKREDTIVTRNIFIVHTLINEGYAKCLCEVFKEKVGTKTAYKFLADEAVRKIKADGDIESKRYYDEKMKMLETSREG